MTNGWFAAPRREYQKHYKVFGLWLFVCVCVCVFFFIWTLISEKHGLSIISKYIPSEAVTFSASTRTNGSQKGKDLI